MKTETADDQDHGTPPDVISSEKTSNHSTPRALNAAEVRALELQPDASAEGGTREFWRIKTVFEAKEEIW